MTWLEAVILGIVQGFSEFLPISSSGHLVLFQHIFKIGEGAVAFDVWLHVGTLVPVFIVFRKEILAILRKPVQKLTLLLIIATIPAVIAALLFDNSIESLFTGRVTLLALGFTITGVALLLADYAKPRRGKNESAMSTANALVVGCAQAVAMAPSISRSGSTTAAALFCGMEREAAARVSFLLSIPAIGGAAILEIYKLFKPAAEAAAEVTASIPTQYAVIGAVAAALSGYISVTLMLSVIRRAKLKYFAFYVFAVAAFILIETFILKGAVFGSHTT